MSRSGVGAPPVAGAVGEIVSVGGTGATVGNGIFGGVMICRLGSLEGAGAGAGVPAAPGAAWPAAAPGAPIIPLITALGSCQAVPAGAGARSGNFGVAMSA